MSEHRGNKGKWKHSYESSYLVKSVKSKHSLLLPWKKLLQILAFLLFLAIAAFEVLREPHNQRLTFFFPSAPAGQQGAEIRYLAIHEDQETLLRAMIKELFLGPREIKLQPFFPVTQGLNNAIIDGGIAYVDLKGDFLLLSTEQQTPFFEQLQFLEKNILFNFSQLRKVIITIDGQQPGWSFSPALLKYQ